tara:strand:+ start:17811 stop:18485 length:675 start_codon:yes stop_codon:yes gene_type:complete
MAGFDFSPFLEPVDNTSAPAAVQVAPEAPVAVVKPEINVIKKSVEKTPMFDFSDYLEAVTDVEVSLAEGSATQAAFIEYEGKNYNTLYGNFETGNTPFKDYQVSTKTVGELIEFSRASGAYGQYVKPRLGKATYAYKNGLTSTPMGRYQIIGATMRDTVNRMGLPTNTIFSKDVQDEMFLFLAREKIEMGKTPRAKRQNLRGLWEGFKKVTDAELDAVIAEIGT